MTCMIDGDPLAPLLVVGMAPGREELTADRPFVGGSGRLLWSLFKRAGIDRADCYLVNTIGEWPEKQDGNPSQEQYEKYWDAFNSAVGASHARIVVCLGGAAFWRVTGIAGGIEAWRGYLVSPDECRPLRRTRQIVSAYKTTNKTRGYVKGDPKLTHVKVSEAVTLPDQCDWILPTLHPAGVMRAGFSSLPALAADLKRVRRALDHELRESSEAFMSYPVDLEGEILAFDIETSMDTGVIERIGLADSRVAWTAPWDHQARSAAQRALDQPGVIKAGHNVAFDIPHLAKAGVDVCGPIFDTMLAAQMLQPDLYKGLNAVASLYLDCKRWKHLSSPEPEKYNALDARRTAELAVVLRAELKASGQLALFENTVMPSVRVLMGMTKRGIRVDSAHRNTWLEELRTREAVALESWQRTVGPVNPASPKQLSSLLYQDWNLPMQFNKYGGMTTDVASLRDLIKRPECVAHRAELELLLELRNVSKMRGTYAEQRIAADGCVHPGYLPGGKDSDDGFGKGLAGTGRITAREPNIQNQPKEARRLFIPHTSDLVLVEADFSKAELRIAAALSDDVALKAALEGDVWGELMAVLNCDKTRAKNMMYGTLYGGGPKTISRVLKAQGYVVTETECKAMQNTLARAYPRLWAWRQGIVSTVAKEYALSNPFGRRRYFYRGADDAPAAIDFLPQSTAADILWHILPELDEAVRGCGGALLATVHDSVLVELPRSRVSIGIAAVRGVMEQTFPQIAEGFHVPAEIKVGDNWGEMFAWPEVWATALPEAA